MQDTRRKIVRRIWTEQEKETVRMMYPDHDTREIAELLGRKISQVYNMADRLDLHKSESTK